ncbi:clathrin heavy chain-like [Oppia nitens]|uniref:clathrin heavy chain-like n=1 Tax=Oppia nitens TaxID=1686743 RepID=UPI0023D9DD19|nr:clathrin heavy chain-like [Oppia nitens]
MSTIGDDDDDDNEPVINVTQLVQLTDLGINEKDINWSKVKINSYRWIAVRHSKPMQECQGLEPMVSTEMACSLPSEAYYPHLFSPYHRNYSCDDLQHIRNSHEGHCPNHKTNGAIAGVVSQETVITVINPFTNHLYNCQTSCDTKCAQISADNEMIAISNDRYLAVYCVATNKCLNTLPFASRCLYWCWIASNTIAIITDIDVYHWCIDYPFEPKLVFKLDKRFRDYQITGYKCDLRNQLWFAISSLYVDDEGDINGCIQIYSERNQLSQCIEAHAFTLCEYRFQANRWPTNVLLAAKRSHMNTFKIYIIELGPIPEGNNSLISRTEVIPLVDGNDVQHMDIPVAIECNTELGLIYVFTKYGALYLCDMDSAALIQSAVISASVVFAALLDDDSQTVLAINRSGQLLSINLFISQLIRNLTDSAKPEIAQRIQAIVDSETGSDGRPVGDDDDDDEDCDEVTRL